MKKITKIGERLSRADMKRISGGSQVNIGVSCSSENACFLSCYIRLYRKGSSCINGQCYCTV